MKIVLVSPPILIIFPVGISYISAVLKKAGHEVIGVTYCDPKSLETHLDSSVDFLATGGLSTQFRIIKEIIDVARTKKIKTICGGGIVTSDPAFASANLGIDYAVLGEGENTIVELLKCLKIHGDLSSVDGIGYFENSKFKTTNPRKPILNLDSIPFPDFEGFDFEGYLNRMKCSALYNYYIFDYPREYPLVCSRSCPYNCTFCYHPLGQKYRQRSIASIIEELKIVIPKYKINILALLDDLFSYDEKRVFEFCTELKKLQATIPWEIKWWCNMRVDKINEEMIIQMKDAGLYMLGFGFESYSPQVLKSMKKFITPSQIHRAIHLTKKHNIAVQGNFILGDRAETLQTANETMNFWRAHRFFSFSLGLILPVPDSEIYQFCVKNGLIKDKLAFFNDMHTPINFSSMTEWEYLYLKIKILWYQMKYAVKQIPIKNENDTLVIKCPYCKEVISYHNYYLPKNPYMQQITCRNCNFRYYIVEPYNTVLYLKNIAKTIIYPISKKLLPQRLKKAIKNKWEIL